ncbi:MAG: hypothetical protein IJW77_08235 [Clostridia bacterium]|nr:hypothetical protein [Clostridia bacterium]
MKVISLIAFAPFRDFLALIIFNRNFDLPQYRFAGLADSTTQGGNRPGCVEIKDVQKILVDKILTRLQSASGHQNIGGTYHRRIAKGNTDVEIIILLKERICNDVEYVALVIVPVFIHQLCRDNLQLFGKSLFTGDLKATFQCRCYNRFMFLSVFPKKRAARVLAATGVGYIEYIFQFWTVAVRVDQCDTLGAAPDISVQRLAVPEVIRSAGGRIRTLGEDHKLLMVGVLIQPCGGIQKSRPLPIGAGDLSCRVVCHLRV